MPCLLTVAFTLPGVSLVPETLSREPNSEVGNCQELWTAIVFFARRPLIRHPVFVA